MELREKRSREVDFPSVVTPIPSFTPEVVTGIDSSGGVRREKGDEILSAQRALAVKEMKLSPPDHSTLQATVGAKARKGKIESDRIDDRRKPFE